MRRRFGRSRLKRRGRVMRGRRRVRSMMRRRGRAGRRRMPSGVGRRA